MRAVSHCRRSRDAFNYALSETVLLTSDQETLRPYSSLWALRGKEYQLHVLTGPGT